MDNKCKCPSCGKEMFPVYFGNDNLYKGVVYQRCMNCNLVTLFKDETQKKKVSE